MKRKNHAPEFKAKVALEAIREAKNGEQGSLVERAASVRAADAGAIEPFLLSKG
jgi:hypothetical protein